jgi:thiamine biosynthesis protein ThiC
MSQAFNKKETERSKTNINNKENSETILDINSNKSINEITKCKISKMELDIEVIFYKQLI